MLTPSEHVNVLRIRLETFNVAISKLISKLIKTISVCLNSLLRDRSWIHFCHFVIQRLVIFKIHLNVRRTGVWLTTEESNHAFSHLTQKWRLLLLQQFIELVHSFLRDRLLELFNLVTFGFELNSVLFQRLLVNRSVCLNSFYFSDRVL